MPNPLNRRILKKRFSVFEMITLPCLKAQENKNFTWIIIVDSLIPDKYRQKFIKVSADMQNVFLHTFTPEVAEESLNWMTPYIQPNAEYVITSNLDADDGIYKGFTKDVQDYFAKLKFESRIQPMHFISSEKTLQWDFYKTHEAPFGYLKPWGRQATVTIASGLTICCKYPEMDFSVLKAGHRLVHFLFNREQQNNLSSEDLSRLKKLEGKIQRKALNSNLNWDGILNKEIHFHNLDADEPQILMPNNFLNVRFIRIFEKAESREVLIPETSIPGFGIDYIKVASGIKTNKKSVFLLIRILWNFLTEKNYVKSHEIKKDLKRSIYIIKGFRQM